MREALFTVSSRPDGTLIAECTALRLAISGMNREELQEEARDALIRAIGPAHVSYRVRLEQSAPCGGRPLQRIQTWKRLQPQ